MHILALSMRVYIHVGLKKLKLLFTCEISAFYQFLGCFVNIFLENSEEKFTAYGCLVTVNTTFFFPA